MPRTIASAVISTGRSRVAAGVQRRLAAPRALGSSARASLAKLTSRMRFETAMPTAMIAPMNDSTLSVVPVIASIQTMPTNAPGTATMMMSGSSTDWNSTISSR